MATSKRKKPMRHPSHHEKNEKNENGDTRQQLIRAGTELFSKKGLEGTTVRDIAARASTNICMVSYHFDGKEGLYRSCLEAYGRQRLETVRELFEPAKSSEEFKVKLKLIVTTLVNSQLENSDSSKMLQHEIEEGLPIAREVFEATFLRLSERMIQFFQSAQKNGLMRPSLDARFVVHTLYGTVGNLIRCDAVVRQYYGTSITQPKERDRFIETLSETLLSGVLERQAN